MDVESKSMVKAQNDRWKMENMTSHKQSMKKMFPQTDLTQQGKVKPQWVAKILLY